MNDWFITFLSLSAAGTLLIMVLFIFRPVYKDKLSKKWQYYIWLIVIARLLIPYTPQSSLVNKWFTDINIHMIQPVINAYYGNDESGLSEPEQDNTYVTPIKADETNEIKADEALTASQKDSPDLSGIWLLWLAAAFALFIRKITIYQSFTKYVRAGSKEVNDIKLLDEFGRIIEKQQVRGGIDLCTNNLISSPLLIGIWKPCIVLPAMNLSPPDFEFTILHELTHYKRKDMFYKWLVQFVICLHWFNPFVYLLSKEINRMCELSCDETVISKLNAGQMRAYGDTLLNAVNNGGSYNNSIASVTLCESKILLRERLGAIMVYRKQSKIFMCLSGVLAALFAGAAVYIGAYPVQKGADTAQAPDNIPIYTAEAENVTIIEKPNVDIIIDNNAAVKLVPSAGSEITAEYGSSLYRVDITNVDGNWNIHITYTGSYSKYPSAVVYIPAIDYGDINIQAKQATLDFSGVFQSCGIINADMELSSIFYTIPAGFTGELKAAAGNSYLELYSDNDYNDSDITISNCPAFGQVPDSFIKQARDLICFNGRPSGMISFDLEGTGYAVIN